MAEHDLEGELDAFLAGHQAELVDFRRDLHAHPEIGYHEFRTTRRTKLRLEAAGLRPVVLPKGTGLLVDIGAGSEPDVGRRGPARPGQTDLPAGRGGAVRGAGRARGRRHRVRGPGLRAALRSQA